MNELIARLLEQGVELWTDGVQLRYRGPRRALGASTLEEIKQNKEALLAALKGGWVTKTFPLSHPQRALWYLYQSAKDSSAYNTALAVRLRFDPEEEALREALQGLLVRHPSLRTTFAPSGGEGSPEPVQRVHAYQPAILEELDASAWSEADLEARVRACHQRPFDLENGPALRATLFHRGAADHVLLVSIHHIVCDGWSMWLLMDELWRAYADLAGPAPVAPEVIPPSQALWERLAAVAGQPGGDRGEEDVGGREALELFVRRGVAAAFDAMGAWRGAGPTSKAALGARLGVHPRYARLFDALLELLVEARAASIGEDGLVARSPVEGGALVDQQALSEEAERLRRTFPELGAYVDLTAVCLEALPQVLAGKRDAMEVLFPGGSTQLVERTYRGNQVADANNQRIARFVKAYVEERLRTSPEAVIDILEVGAGTGGTSAGVLQALSELGRRGRVRYHYTDVSPAFVRGGEGRFGAEFPFVRFRALDVERGPAEQGFAVGNADLVIASHVIHATRRIDASLGHVKDLLKKNGLLVLNETTIPQAFLTVTFGLMDGWWRFEDAEQRIVGSPLLDRARWGRALERRGFTGVRYAGEGGPAAESSQTVIVASSDGALGRVGEGVARPPETYERFVAAEAEMLASPEGEAHWAYWRRQLGGALPVLELPLDRPRPVVQTHRGQWVPFRISPALTARLRQRAAERNVTVYGLLLAGYQMLLARYSGQEDVVVGCPTAGRHQRAFDRIVGHFVNTVPVRVDLSGDPSVDQAIDRTRAALLGALEHQAFPFTVLVDRLNPRRDAGRPPVFQTMFVFQEPPQDLPLAEVVTDFYSGSARARIHGLDFESFPVSQQEGQFDLSIEVIGTGEALKGVLKYNQDLFDAASMERMSRHFVTVLEGMVEHPEVGVSAIPLLARGEREEVLHRWNDTAREWPLECVHWLVEEQARRTPDAPAVRFEGRTVSYGELDRQADRLAKRLVALDVAAEEPVALCLERSVEMLVAVLGILKAGCAYLPLDPHYPKERLAFMLDDAGARVLVTSRHLTQRLPFLPKQAVFLDPETADDEDGRPLARRGDPSRLAYLLYTSGSTGRPKGVAMPHGPLCNLLRWQLEHSDAGPGARTLQFTTLSFDVSFQEIFATLAAGGTLVLLSEALKTDPEGMLRLVRDERVERIFVPFVILKLIAEAVEGNDELAPAHLKEIITAGEQLKVTPAVVNLMRRLDGCRLVNQYGPTEAHVVTAHHLIGSPDRWPYLPPIGRPIANARIYLLDPRLQPVPPGVPGELFIGGACLARGYHRQEALTAERFIASPFAAGERLYRTGDLARFRADGAIEYLGRADQQVKVHGFRIEPAEIEKQLAAHPRVAEAVVVCDEDAAGLKRLCAYYVPRQGSVEVAALKAHLQETLPTYMVPSVFVELPAIPLTPNGKVDRRALPAAGAAPSGRHLAPRDAIEAGLVELCRSALKLEQLGVDDSLFDLGVNSLTTLSLQRQIDKAYPGTISVPDLLRFPTIAELAAAVRSRSAVASSPSKRGEQYQRFLEALSGTK